MHRPPRPRPRSDDINDYLKAATGDDFTAMDFRTWSATVLCAVALAVSGEAAATATGRKRAMVRAVKEVAHYLGNTPAVARSAYIDPRVVDRFEKDDTVEDALVAVDLDDLDAGIPEEVEKAVLDLIDRARRTKRRARRPRRA